MKKNKRQSLIQSLMKTTKSDLIFQNLEIVNKKLINLSKRKELGSYASKKLLKNIRISNTAVFDKKAKKIKITSPSKMTSSQKRLLNKQLEQFIKSKTSSAKNIKSVRSETIKKVKEQLGNITDKDISDKDVDEFFDMSNDSDYNYFSDFIDPSDFYALLSSAKEEEMDEETFISSLEMYMTVNDENTRNKAKRLYEKFV